MIKIEDLKKEWANLLKRIDIPYVELPYKNVTQTDDQEYKKFYNNDSSELLITLVKILKILIIVTHYGIITQTNYYNF